MGLVRHALVSESVEPNGLVVRAALPVDLHLKIQQDKATTVYADEIIVRGNVSTAGHDVTLFCRVLHFEAGGRIDASGAPGLPSYAPEQRPEGARDPGAHGPDGADGAQGGPGGRILIRSGSVVGKAVLLAAGGRGGRAQDGGHGQTGATGPGGSDVRTNRWDHVPPEANGGQGGRGGSAGLPGRRGHGGPGGVIDMVLLQAANPADVDAQAPAGQSAPAALPGQAGGGGPGGGGGRVTYRECEWMDRPGRWSMDAPQSLHVEELAAVRLASPPTEFSARQYGQLLDRAAAPVPMGMSCTNYDRGTGATGPSGPGGDTRDADVAARNSPVPVADGAVTLGTVSVDAFTKTFDPVFLDLLVAQMEDEYRLDGIKPSSSLRDKIDFWLTVLAGETAHTEALARLYGVARKAALGLDVYGYSLEQAPLLQFDTYQNLVREAITSARTIENSYNEYWARADKQDAALAQLMAARSAAKESADALVQQQERTADNIALLRASLPNLDAAVLAAYAVLMRRYDELTAAIRAENQGCDLVGTLTAAATIVAGVSTGGAGFITAAAAGTRLYDRFTAEGVGLEGLWDERNVIQKDLQEVAKGAGTVKDAIEKIRDAVGTLTPEERELPRFVVERQQFDDIAAQFIELPQAQEYKEAGYHYLKCVETRNQAIVDYNALLVQWIGLQAMVAAGRRIERTLTSDIGVARDLTQGTIMGIMTRLYVDALALAGHMVHASGKALAYLFGQPAGVQFSTLDVASISSAHGRIMHRWVSFKEGFRPKRDLNPGALEFNLRDFVTNDTWKNFLETGKLPFTLRRNHPGYAGLLRALTGLRITGATIALDGAVAPQGLKYLVWDILQYGHETIYPSEQMAVNFSHRFVSAKALSAFNGAQSVFEDDFTEDELYAGVSPFASWIITCDAATLGRIQQVENVMFRVSGYFVESGDVSGVPAELMAWR